MLHTSDEDIPEEGPKPGLAYRDRLVRQVPSPAPLPQRPVPTHVLGYRTTYAKSPGMIQIVTDGHQVEVYDYAKFGIGEVTNNAPSGPMPETELFADLYRALFDPQKGALVNELRQPLPPFLQQVQRQAISDYLAFEASLQDR